MRNRLPAVSKQRETVEESFRGAGYDVNVAAAPAGQPLGVAQRWLSGTSALSHTFVNAKPGSTYCVTVRERTMLGPSENSPDDWMTKPETLDASPKTFASTLANSMFRVRQST